MNEFQLKELATADLREMRSAIDKVLRLRQQDENRHKRRAFIKALSTADFDTLRKYNAEVIKWNSSKLLSVPGHGRKKKQNLSVYLPALLAQSWPSQFTSISTNKDFYVYAHVDPRKSVFVTDQLSGGNYGGMPFYIGKGRGNRAFDLKRNQGHGKLLTQLTVSGYESSEIVKILIGNLDESQAFTLEAKLIYFFGTIYQKTDKYGCLVNLDTPQVPNFIGEMELLIGRDKWRETRASLPHPEGTE